MPYKDPEERRRYQREYKRRQRAGLTGTRELVTKCYACPKYPGLPIEENREYFQNGFYITGDPDIQDLIESHEFYGKYVWGWRVEP